jgi:hypothetical protein
MLDYASSLVYGIHCTPIADQINKKKSTSVIEMVSLPRRKKQRMNEGVCRSDEIVVGRGNPNYSEKNLYQFHIFHHISHTDSSLTCCIFMYFRRSIVFNYNNKH